VLRQELFAVTSLAQAEEMLERYLEEWQRTEVAA
jgi:hypothetical protein